jgi:hypothetical protein
MLKSGGKLVSLLPLGPSQERENRGLNKVTAYGYKNAQHANIGFIFILEWV